ncbi:hypothetical protein FPOAC2_06608 [Fusarium poae]|uniref:BTB domain-containing protein n=1 Tax=Fusarium poae TaxID=36050 RepID=A0A1B8AXX0_FUSPO|nr:hypothetical protein FPOAC1_006483 [Fusarium poae]KAG8673177.1 hypothetical protein FPOAC1_006483 [Fusarium poae]OBS25375.1 hypothetical protein FPOA_05908 [Fusarium poae]
MTGTPAKRQKVGYDSPSPNDTPSFEDFSPDGDVIFIVQGKTRVRVLSAVMRCASPVFAAMLRSNFKEGCALAESEDIPVEIPLPEDDAEEFGWICRVLHCQAHTMLWKPTLSQVSSVWLLVDKYDMKDSIKLSLNLWTSESIKEPYSDHAFWILAVASLRNQEAGYFKHATRQLILNADIPFITIASTMERTTQAIASESVAYKLAGKLQATRDSAIMESNKFLYGDLPAIVLNGCASCTKTYLKKIHRHIRDRIFKPADSRLICIRAMILAIYEWAQHPRYHCPESPCGMSIRNIEKKTSEFLKVGFDGLCLDCFGGKSCHKHA